MLIGLQVLPIHKPLIICKECPNEDNRYNVKNTRKVREITR